MLEFKSYRGWVIKMFLPALILSLIASIIMITYYVCVPDDNDTELWTLICAVLLDLILVVTVLTLKFYKGKKFIFSSNEISIYDNKTFIEKIDLTEVESMEYRSWKYLSWRLLIKTKCGEVKKLGFLSLKDARQIKEFYGDIVTINN